MNRVQFLELADKTARTRCRRQPDYLRELQGVPDLMPGAVRDSYEVGNAQQIRAELTGLQTCTDQRLDQIAIQI